MDRLLQAAETVLRRHAAPALRLTELLRHVRRDLGALTPDAEALRRALQTRPDRFRVLDPWRGPWRHVARDPSCPLGGDPWVVVVGDPGDDGVGLPKHGRETTSRSERRLRASVRWLAAGIDGGTSGAVARFHVIAMAAETTTLRVTEQPHARVGAKVKRAA